jgi:hypothetical protein
VENVTIPVNQRRNKHHSFFKKESRSDVHVLCRYQRRAVALQAGTTPEGNTPRVQTTPSAKLWLKKIYNLQ